MTDVGHPIAGPSSEDILRAAAVLHGRGEMIEVRAFGSRAWSGIYSSVEEMAKDVASFERRHDDYETIAWTINPIGEPPSGANRDRLSYASTGSCISDHDIVGINWIPIDIDPARPTSVSATESEHGGAIRLAEEIAAALRARGAGTIVLADSGNGAHLLVRVDLPTEKQELVKTFLGAVSERWSSPEQKIDCSVSNAGRVIKIYGTVARKGQSSAERPHRRSLLIDAPVDFESTTPASIGWLEEIVREFGTPRQARAASPSLAAARATSPRYVADVEQCLQRWGMEYHEKDAEHGQTTFVFSCQWEDHEHEERNPRAYAVQFKDGTAMAACLANRCAGRDFGDLAAKFGEHFEPATPTTPRDSARRLIGLKELFSRPEIPWLVPGIIPAGRFVVLTGDPNVGKSALALDLALSLACGQSWLDRDVLLGQTLYVAGEGVDSFRGRSQAWLAYHGIQMRAAAPNISFLDCSINLGETAGADDLIRLMRDAQVEPKLIVVDTLARSMPGLDENSARDMSKFVDGVDKLRNELGATVLVLHHKGKGDKGHYRGSSALEGAADSMLTLEARGGCLQLECHKQRDAGRFAPIPLVLKEYGQSIVVTALDAVEAATLLPSKGRERRQTERLMLHALQTVSADNRSSGAWLDAAEALGISRRTGSRQIKQLERQGTVLNTGARNRASWEIVD